jgi:hypothetical protein
LKAAASGYTATGVIREFLNKGQEGLGQGKGERLVNE